MPPTPSAESRFSTACSTTWAAAWERRASALQPPPELRDDSLQRLVVDVIEELAGQGNVVHHQRTAPPLSLAGVPDAPESTSQRRQKSIKAGIGIGWARSKSGSQVDP